MFACQHINRLHPVFGLCSVGGLSFPVSLCASTCPRAVEGCDFAKGLEYEGTACSGALGPWGDWVPRSQGTEDGTIKRAARCAQGSLSCLAAFPKMPCTQAQVLVPGSCGTASLFCIYHKSQALWSVTSCLC